MEKCRKTLGVVFDLFGCVVLSLTFAELAGF